METKVVNRNIPVKRENINDRFRVNYNNRSYFKNLQVVITRAFNSDKQVFNFTSASLPDKDSIHFSASVVDNRLHIKWFDAEPLYISDPTIIELKPEWFRMGYYVYIVVIVYKNKRYYYVGMTGDRKHKVARSPFYRMGGHFSQLKSSTQNQIIRGLKSKVGIQNVEQALTEIKFTYYSYLIEPFDRTDITLHSEKRKRTEQIESYLIGKMKATFQEAFVFNKNKSVREYGTISQIGSQLFTDFRKRLNLKSKNAR